MIVAGRELSSGILTQLEQLAGHLSRRKLAQWLCEHLGWCSPGGELALMSTRKVLARLTKEGHLAQPVLKFNNVRRARPEKLPDCSPLEGLLADLPEVELLLLPLGNRELSQEWNALMEHFHYLGSGPLCGAQLRYLIRSGGRTLGGLSFSAAAWRTASREKWIGWSDEARRENLHLVVNNSRFLIAPYVKVENLASHVLSKAMRRLAIDWHERYGYEPVLVETFVELNRFKGVSYQAANFQTIGITTGRTRQGRTDRPLEAKKAVLVYALRKDWRPVLQQLPEIRRFAAPPEKPPAPPPAPPEDWAEEEFMQASLEKRLIRRCCTIARQFFARPRESMPVACASPDGLDATRRQNGPHQTRRSQMSPQLKAAYRFFSNPRVTMSGLLAGHREATGRRMAGHKIVLAPQDTTTLNYTAHPATEGIGPIGSGNVVGLMVHSMMAMDTEGVPLGLVDVQCWARDPDLHAKRSGYQDLPLEQKESVRWLRSLEKLEQLQAASCRETTTVAIGDRESDIYELFVWAKAKPMRPELIVRAEHDRPLCEENKLLWEHVAATEIAGAYELQTPRSSNQPGRKAQVTVRFARIQINPPKRKKRLGPVEIYAVLVREENPPPGCKNPIEWMLLTTLAVVDLESAMQVVRWYARRWGIEVYHRVLKQGCRIQDRQLATADSLAACLAIDMVVAWRIFHLTMLSRATPDVPCDVVLEEYQWKALMVAYTGNPVAPEQAPTLRQATRMIAGLGGFLGRKCDGEPGVQTLWIGIQRLDDLARMYCVMTARPPPGVQ